MIEEIAAQYGLAGVALAIIYLMFSQVIKMNAKAMTELSEAINNLNQSLGMLQTEVRTMQNKIDRMSDYLSKSEIREMVQHLQGLSRTMQDRRGGR